jgi:hypothetical protein
MRVLVRGGMALASAALMLVASATTAFAGDGYGAVAGESSGGAGSSGGSTLPFTGADLALYAVVGALLVATGLVLRRYERRDATTPASDV